jgi:hypothetical protein
MIKDKYKELKNAGLTDQDIDLMIEIAIYQILNKGESRRLTLC